MSKIKIGVIGIGNMGYNHARVYNELFSDAELVGVFDNDTDRAKHVADKFNIKCFSTIDGLLGSVFAVSVATPTSFHLEHGLQVADAGVHALIEKPIAASYDDGKRLVKAFSDKNLILQIGHIERYNPAIVELKRILETEKILAVNFNRLSSDRRIHDTDIVHDLMIHDIDIMSWLIGSKINSVHAEGITNVLGKGSVDHSQCLIRFENGVIAGLSASRITEDKIRTIFVHTDNSYIQVDCVSRSIQISRKTNYKLDVGRDITYRQENILEKVIVRQYEPLKEQLADFIRCIKAGEEPLVNGNAGLEAVKIADDISRMILL